MTMVRLGVSTMDSRGEIAVACHRDAPPNGEIYIIREEDLRAPFFSVVACMYALVCVYAYARFAFVSVPPETATCGAEHRLRCRAVAVVFHVFTHCPKTNTVLANSFLCNTCAAARRVSFLSPSSQWVVTCTCVFVVSRKGQMRVSRRQRSHIVSFFAHTTRRRVLQERTYTYAQQREREREKERERERERSHARGTRTRRLELATIPKAAPLPNPSKCRIWGSRGRAQDGRARVRRTRVGKSTHMCIFVSHLTTQPHVASRVHTHPSRASMPRPLHLPRSFRVSTTHNDPLPPLFLSLHLFPHTHFLLSYSHTHTYMYTHIHTHTYTLSSPFHFFSLSLLLLLLLPSSPRRFFSSTRFRRASCTSSVPTSTLLRTP